MPANNKRPSEMRRRLGFALLTIFILALLATGIWVKKYESVQTIGELEVRRKINSTAVKDLTAGTQTTYVIKDDSSYVVFAPGLGKPDSLFLGLKICNTGTGAISDVRMKVDSNSIKVCNMAPSPQFGLLRGNGMYGDSLRYHDVPKDSCLSAWNGLTSKKKFSFFAKGMAGSSTLKSTLCLKFNVRVYRDGLPSPAVVAMQIEIPLNRNVDTTMLEPARPDTAQKYAVNK